MGIKQKERNKRMAEAGNQKEEQNKDSGSSHIEQVEQEITSGEASKKQRKLTRGQFARIIAEQSIPNY